MKFFHLSDLHIGLKLFNRDLREDQEYILQQITELAVREQPDAVVVAGDIYDKAVPSAEAVEVFDHFIAGLTKVLPDTSVMLISGNHDSGPRVNCFRSVLSRQNVHMIGLPPRTEEEFIEKAVLTDEYGRINIYLLPFVKPSMVKRVVGTDENGNNLSYNETLTRLIGREQINEEERNVLVSHQFYLPAGKSADEVERMDSEIRTVGNIDQVSAGILERFDYAALGHIHKPMKVGSESIRYCGTPLKYSFSEANHYKSVTVVELGVKGELQVHTIPLTPRHNLREISGTFDELTDRAYYSATVTDDYLHIILTDEEDVPEALGRLRVIYPNIMRLSYDNTRTRSSQVIGSAVQVKSRSPLDLFEELYQLQSNQPMSEVQRTFTQELIESIQEGRV